MASPFDNRAITPVITSLSHLCVVKVALPLRQDFGLGLLALVFDHIQRGIKYLETMKVLNPESKRISRAHKSLLLMPALLRKNVIEAVADLEFELDDWKRDHEYIPRIKDKNHIIHWRSDGTIGRIKTAQQLIIDSDIDIMTRFEVACNYCLVEGILTLWTQLVVSGNTGHFNIHRFMVSFWVQRMRGSSDDPWPEDALEYLVALQRQSRVTALACCRSIFPLLQVADRERFLVFFRFANADDLRFCLYTMTKEEQEKVLGTCTLEVLCLYSKQTLRGFFLETAKKIWNYIDETTFRRCLEDILIRNSVFMFIKDWEVSIGEDFWNLGPDNFRERAREKSYFRETIDSFSNEKKRKAGDEMNEQMKKKFR